MDDFKYHLIGKILSGEASTDECKQFDQWLEQSDENKELYEAYQNFWNHSEISEPIPDLKLLIQKRQPKASTYAPQNIKPQKSKAYWAIAASFGALFIISIFIFSNYLQQDQNSDFIASKLTRKSNPIGQKSKIMLPDGSSVWLNSDSELIYQDDFSDSIRLVKLSGEAFFEVVKDTLKPFVVETQAMKATVLGTSFNVNAFSELEEVTVALATGKLSVTSNTNESEVLTPGIAANLNKKTLQITTREIDVDQIASWKNGVLVFESEDFQSVIKKLERWYGVNVTIQGEVSSEWKFTGYFDNEYLKNILEVIIHGKNLKYKLEGKNVTLISK